MTTETAYTKASALCATREHCCFDIREKLLNWGIDDETSKKIISRLVEEKFIDESRYAQFYARDKFKFNGWGKQKMIWTLRLKKIPEKIIQTAIETIDPDDYENKLLYLLQEKSKKTKEKDTVKKRAALIRFAQSKGFETDEIIRIMNTANKNSANLF